MSRDIQSEELLKAIETAIPVTAIEQAIANTQTEEERKRSLPAQLVVSQLFLNLVRQRLDCDRYIYIVPYKIVVKIEKHPSIAQRL